MAVKLKLLSASKLDYHKERAMFSSQHDIFAPHGTFSPAQLLPLLLILPLLVFWIWMFRDMLGNDDLPPNAKESWTFAFILLNVFAAVIYYANIYRFRSKR